MIANTQNSLSGSLANGARRLGLAIVTYPQKHPTSFAFGLASAVATAIGPVGLPLSIMYAGTKTANSRFSGGYGAPIFALSLIGAAAGAPLLVYSPSYSASDQAKGMVLNQIQTDGVYSGKIASTNLIYWDRSWFSWGKHIATASSKGVADDVVIDPATTWFRVRYSDGTAQKYRQPTQPIPKGYDSDVTVLAPRVGG